MHKYSKFIVENSQIITAKISELSWIKTGTFIGRMDTYARSVYLKESYSNRIVIKIIMKQETRKTQF